MIQNFEEIKKWKKRDKKTYNSRNKHRNLWQKIHLTSSSSPTWPRTCQVLSFSYQQFPHGLEKKRKRWEREYLLVVGWSVIKINIILFFVLQYPLFSFALLSLSFVFMWPLDQDLQYIYKILRLSVVYIPM